MKSNLPREQSTNHRSPSAESGTSLLVTLVLTILGILVVRAVMPSLVEQVYYAMERGKQRAQFDVATDRLSEDPISQLSNASQLVSRRIAPSVVHIDTRREEIASVPTLESDSFELVSRQEQREIREQGSGIIMTEDGEILTNHHVIEDAERIRVTLSDNRVVRARVVGIDRIADLALLKVDDVQGLVAAVWSDSDHLREGALVWAAGSPFGLSKTTTFGIVSATERDDRPYRNFLQSDAAVSPGNSGGPLVDATGGVVGVNTAIVGKNFQGISLAIPANRALDVYESVLKPQIDGITEDKLDGWLGVRFAGKGRVNGAIIGGLIQGASPAQEAGIQAGDVVTKWNERHVQSNEMFASFVANASVDEVVTLTVDRAGEHQEIDVTIGVKPLQFY